MKVLNVLRRTVCATSLIGLPLSEAVAQSGEVPPVLARIPWAEGPVIGGLGTIAEVEVPATCRFTDKKGAKMFMEVTENTGDGSELGVLLCGLAGDSPWFVVFSFAESGYVKDDEKATLDGNAILATLRRGNEAANEERRDRGWDELEIGGWQRSPYYDTATHNLTWSLDVRVKGTSDQSVNHSVRLLGRRGVMHADLVADPEQLATAVAAFDSIITTFSYVEGQRYAEWQTGDKVAAFGLTALVAGGAGVAATKLGFFPKLWKMVLGALLALKKLVIVLVVGIAAFFKRIVAMVRDRASSGSSARDSGPTSRVTRTTSGAAKSGRYAPVKPPAVVAPPDAYNPGALPRDGASTNTG